MLCAAATREQTRGSPEGHTWIIHVPQLDVEQEGLARVNGLSMEPIEHEGGVGELEVVGGKVVRRVVIVLLGGQAERSDAPLRDGHIPRQLSRVATCTSVSVSTSRHQ
jgi:hypothetical protein